MRKLSFYIPLVILFLINIFFYKLITKNGSNKLSSLSHCESNSEWLPLSNSVYFKKAASFYLIDLNLINLNFIHLSNDKLKFSVILKIEHLKPGQKKVVQNTIVFEQTDLEYHYIVNDRYDAKYSYSNLNIAFNFKAHFGYEIKNAGKEKIKMKIFIKSLKSKEKISKMKSIYASNTQVRKLSRAQWFARK